MEEKSNKWLVIVNPKAAVGASGKDWPEIKRILVEEGFDFDEFFTQYQGHGIELTQQKITEGGYQKIISVGGDGSFNEVVNGVFLQQRFPTNVITIGIIPVGTGNDWVRTFDFPNGYRKIIKILKAGQTFQHDIGKVTYRQDGETRTRYFINTAGTGFDELVAKTTNNMKLQGKSGKINYLKSLIICLFNSKLSHMKIELDGQEIVDDDIFSMSIGICRYNGGGIMQMPNAIPDDGLFDLTIIRKVKLLRAAANLTNIYDGSFVKKMNEVSTFRGKNIKMRSVPAESIFIETDGETLGHSPFEFDILQKSVNVIVKQSSIRKTHLDAKKQD